MILKRQKNKSNRSLKVIEVIKKSISQILLKNDLPVYPNFQFPLSVVSVDLSSDLRIAYIYVSTHEIIDDEEFMLTYGDGISNVNLKTLYEFYKNNNFLGVVTAVRPPARFGRLKIENETVVEFGEKNQADEGWINGGFFVLNKDIKNYIDGESTIFEKEPLENLSNENRLGAFLHEGFWQCCDTIREKEILEEKIKLEGLDYENR